MQKDQKAVATPRIDLSNCKLLSPYGRNAADIVKVGAKAAINKIGFNKAGVTKPGFQR